jgi:CysZ protein
MNDPQAVVLSERPGFGAGFRALFDGYRYLVRTPDIWPLAIVPIVIALVLAFIFAASGVPGALWLVRTYLTRDDPSMYWTVMLVVIKILSVLLALVVALFLAFALGKPLSGPVLERIVRRVSTDLGAPAWPAPTLAQDIFRSLQSTTVALVFTLPILVPLVVIGFVVPPAAVVTTPLQFIVTAMAAAWDFCDYPLSIRGAPVSERIEFVRRNKRAVMGFGVGLGLLMLLPCTLIIVLPGGVIGAAHLAVVLERWEAAERARLAGPTAG